MHPSILALLLIFSVVTANPPECVQWVTTLTRQDVPVAFEHRASILCDLATSGEISKATFTRRLSQEVQHHRLPPPGPIAVSCCSALLEKFCELQREQGVLRFLTFVNVIWFVSIALGTIALATLIAPFIVKVVLVMPLIVWQGMALVVSMVVVKTAVGYPLNSGTRDYVGLTGTIGLCASITWTIVTMLTDDLQTETFIRRYLPWILTLILCTCASWLRASVIGTLGIGAILMSLGFSVGVAPFTYYIGFNTDTELLRCMAASLLLMVIYIPIRTFSHVNVPILDPYETGVLFWCPLVFHVGLLITSHLHWIGTTLTSARYVSVQLVAICFLVATLFLGTVYDIEQFKSIGGTFTVLYVMTKISELELHRQNRAVGLLLVSCVLWFTAYIVQRNPSYFWQGST